MSLVLGLALIAPSVVGQKERRRWDRIEAELAHAKAEMDTLSVDLRNAAAAGENLSDYLRDRGYSEYDVRRWIVRQAKLPALPRGPETRRAKARDTTP